jgi:hypothetical protein
MFEKIYDCGAEKYWLVCEECNASKERIRTCNKRMCASCGKAIIAERRAEFIFARDRALDRARSFGLLDHDHYARWGEKMLTLTAPHVREHSIQQRIDLLFSAWPRMRDSLKKHLEKDAGKRAALVCWYRTFEWEPGDDQKGHPHFHFWWLSPYIEQGLIQHLWRCALRTAGYPASSLEHVIVYIQDADGASLTLEVIKYVTKEISKDRSRICPKTYARVYEALSGRRLNQASAGLFKDVKGTVTCVCGATGCFRRTNKPPHAVPPKD